MFSYGLMPLFGEDWSRNFPLLKKVIAVPNGEGSGAGLAGWARFNFPLFLDIKLHGTESWAHGSARSHPLHEYDPFTLSPPYIFLGLLFVFTKPS